MEFDITHIIKERIPLSPPSIPPVTEELRPLWSVMIPVYNCSMYLKETLESVLEQCGKRNDVQIEVVDDASTDADVKHLVNSIGKGRIGYFKHCTNVGSLRNFHTCLLRAKGHYVHLLHGDDKIRLGFYDRFEKLFILNPTLGAAYCRYAYIDGNSRLMYLHEREQEQEGILNDFITRLGQRQRIQYVSMVVKRKTYEELGGFYGVEYGEDWEMWMRIAYRFPIGYIPEVLAEYRKHQSSISGRSILTGKNMQELQQVMERIEPLLPAERKSDIIKSSKKFYAHYALRTASQVWSALKSRAGVTAQIREAWKMYKDFGLVFKILKLYTKMTLKL